MTDIEPAYLSLLRSGELERRALAARAQLEACRGCAWKCGTNRRGRKLGMCRTGLLAQVSSYGAHMGEERPLTGRLGSGTIFFTRCSLSCQFCQNHDISQSGVGVEVGAQELAEIMLELQARGCHNINLVTPSHVVSQIIQAVALAAAAGLRLPLIYNTGGYDSLESLHLMDGIIDIYLPDMKFASEEAARRLAKIPHYPQSNQAAVREMYRQVGDLQLDPSGLAVRGLLVRHLVLPGGLSGTAEIASFLARELSRRTCLNLMDQYRPAYKSRQYPPLDRRVTPEEFAAAVQSVRAAGLDITPSYPSP